MKLSPNEIAYVASKYWSGPDLITAVAVSLGESGGDTEAMGRSTSGTSIGNRDHGLWQVSNKWHQLRGDGSPGRLLLAGANWRDPEVNARLAREIYDEAVRAGKDGWSPWSVYTSGSYKTYLPDAEIAVKAPWAPPKPVDLTTMLNAIASSIAVGRLDNKNAFADLKTHVTSEVGGAVGDLELGLKAELGDVENDLETLIKSPHQIVLTTQIVPQ
jgi:hypothetical protein